MSIKALGKAHVTITASSATDTKMQEAHSIPALPAASRRRELARLWRALAYRHKLAELSLYLLLASGLPLWSVFELSWPLERSLLFAHSLMGLALFPVFVLPFWISHRSLLDGARNRLLKLTGRLLEALLLVLAASGFYLLLIGNRGGGVDGLIADVHLYASFALLPLLLRHAWRWSIARRPASLRAEPHSVDADR